MKLTKEVKSQIDYWFEDRTPEEVLYILSKYKIKEEAVTFEEWLKVNKYTQIKEDVYSDEDQNTWFDYELIKKYNEEVMNL